MELRLSTDQGGHQGEIPQEAEKINDKMKKHQQEPHSVNPKMMNSCTSVEFLLPLIVVVRDLFYEEIRTHSLI